MTTWRSIDSKGRHYAGNVLSASRDEDGKITFDYDCTKGGSGQGKFSGTLKGDQLSGDYEETIDGRPWKGKATLTLKGVSGQRHSFSGHWTETLVPTDEGPCTVDLDLSSPAPG